MSILTFGPIAIVNAYLQMMKSNGLSQQNTTLDPTNSLLKYMNLINPQEIRVHILIIVHDVHLDTNPFDTTDFYKTGCI